MKHIRFYALFALLGFAAIVAQIILHRRFIVVFGGNELTVGVVFAAWMLWAGIGNYVLGRVADRLRHIPAVLTGFLFAIGILLPATVLAASLIKAALGLPPPQMTGPHINFLATFILLGPLCFAIGAAMVLSTKILGTGRAEDIGRFYIFDSLGSALGGIIFSWVAIKFLTPLQASFIVSALLLAGTGLFLLKGAGAKVGSVVLTAVFVFLFFSSASIESRCRAIQWQGFNPVADFDSRFGNIIVTENRGEHTLFFDGVPQFSTPLPETYETHAYLPLLLEGDPKDILLIGGGLSGMLGQWRDVDLTSITYLQIDPDVTAAEGRLMVPQEMLSDPRLKIKYLDGRSFLRPNGGACKEHCYDVVVVLAGDPITAAANRFYTEEFFSDVRRVLRPDGIIFFGVFEPTNYLSDETKDLLGTIYATLHRIFPHIIILPLDAYYFAASSERGVLTDDVKILRERLEERNWRAPTLSSQTLFGIFPERIASISQGIKAQAVQTEHLNRDRFPVAYYAGLVLWAEKSGEGAAAYLKALTRLQWWQGVAAIFAAIVFSFLFRKKSPYEACAVWALAAVGFSSIVYEIVLLIWYQVKVGLLFYRLGIIITAFMVGLSLGAYLAIRGSRFMKRKRRTVTLLLVVFAGYMPLLFLISKVSFPAANFLCGLVCGVIYQVVANILVERKGMIGRSAGLINFADYAGAAAGSLVASIILVPLFGLKGSLLAGAAFLVAAAVIQTTFLRPVK